MLRLLSALPGQGNPSATLRVALFLRGGSEGQSPSETLFAVRRTEAAPYGKGKSREAAWPPNFRCDEVWLWRLLVLQ